MRTRLRTASLRTSASTTLSVETPLETCRWKLRFYKVQKVRYLLLQPLLRALQQSVLSVSTDLSTSPEKYAFAVNRLGNHALLTIQKMPVCVDTGWIPPPFNMAQYPVKPSISAIFYIATSAVLGCLHKAKTRLNGRAGGGRCRRPTASCFA